MLGDFGGQVKPFGILPLPKHYALTITEKLPDGSISLNTHTGAGMKMLGGCNTPDQCLALALTWYDDYAHQDVFGLPILE